MRLGGVSEVADEIGVSPQRLRVLRTSASSPFPDPIAELSAGPVWDLDEVARWNASRRGGRPPSNVLGGRFELEPDVIGSGGFADVYRATDREQPDEVVAVKVLRHTEEGDSADRFRRELQLLQRLEHPNIIPVLGSGVDRRGHPWYAMPLAVGNLHDVLGELKDEPDVIIDVMLQIGEGLAYLHGMETAEGEVGVFHRDLCPRNILRTGASTWAIADFGLAREAERRSVALTQTSVVAGHIQYLAPEQLDGLKRAEAPADVYSLGRTLQALLLGRDPHLGEAYEADTPFRPVVKRATKALPTERYHSIEEMIEDLQAIEAAPQGAWEYPPARLEQICNRLRETGLHTHRQLDEFRHTVLHLATDDELKHTASKAFPSLSATDIQYYLTTDRPAFRAMISVWSHSIASEGYGFAFCDLLADFGERVVTESGTDDELLEMVLHGLVELGHNHNRWHVRSTVVRLLQQIRDTDEALIALNTLRHCSPSAVEWNVTSFAHQTLHPVLRAGIPGLF